MNEQIYLEQIEKALRGDKRFSYRIKDESNITIWNLMAILEKGGYYNSYLGDNVFEHTKEWVD